MSEPVTKIGKYNIIEQVGEGAMGVVYKAVDPVLNRSVAIKVMSEGMAQDDALRKRFLREAQAAGSLQHPNVVTIYDFGETEGHLFIAMEFIEGTDLEKLLLRETEIPLPAKLEIMIDVLNGLSYAHRRGIVHRDIKPANIRIDSEGHARIMDFGVAHLATSNLTGTGVMMGTPNYMAPELITTGDVTPAADLFSTGAVLYELLTSAKPFAADTLHRVLFRIVSDPPPDLLETAPHLPPALAKIIAKSLSKDLAYRYHTANEMANDLSAVRSSLGAPRASRTVSQRSSIEKALLVQRETKHTRELRRWQTGTAVGAALVLVIVVGFVLGSRRSSAPPSPQAPAPVVTSIPGSDTTPPLAVAADSLRPPLASTPAAAASATDPRAAGTKAPAQSNPTVQRVARRDSVAAPTRPRESSGTGSRAPATAAASLQSAPTSQQAASQAAANQPAGGTVTSTPPVAQAPAPVPLPPPTTTAAARDTTPVRAPVIVENPRVAAGAIIAAYARAIGTRDVAEVKRVYPGMTAAQQRGWEALFASVRSMAANLEIANLDVATSTAVARVTGAYEFVTRAGRTERQPASFEATFARDGERWALRTIK